MVCRVRENTPDDRRMMPYVDTGLSDQEYEEEYYGSETEPDDSDLLTDPDDDCYIDVSNLCFSNFCHLKKGESSVGWFEVFFVDFIQFKCENVVFLDYSYIHNILPGDIFQST